VQSFSRSNSQCTPSHGSQRFAVNRAIPVCPLLSSPMTPSMPPGPRRDSRGPSRSRAPSTTRSVSRTRRNHRPASAREAYEDYCETQRHEELRRSLSPRGRRRILAPGPLPVMCMNSWKLQTIGPMVA
jgi:hypothetical protein